MKTILLSGTVHDQIPKDLELALRSNTTALKAWEEITVLARNEWICWVLSPKTDATRQKHIERTIDELAQGARRPCCWIGCIHRTDKAISPSVKAVLDKRSNKSS